MSDVKEITLVDQWSWVPYYVNESVDLDQMVRDYLEKVGPIRRAPWHERVMARVGCWLISLGEKLGGDSERYFG